MRKKTRRVCKLKNARRDAIGKAEPYEFVRTRAYSPKPKREKGGRRITGTADRLQKRKEDKKGTRRKKKTPI